MDSNMKNIKKVWLNSLSFLDNSVINSIIVIILILYSSGIFENINIFIASIYDYSLIRLIILLLIVYFAPKDITIAILLAISYLVSLHFMKHSEHFYSNSKYVKPEHEERLVKQMAQIALKPSKKETKESFFNFNNIDNEIPPPTHTVNKTNKTNKMEESYEINNNLPKSACMEMYDPKFEEVSDVCSPTATFKNELNAQGLNFPEGFNSPYVGSPL